MLRFRCAYCWVFLSEGAVTAVGTTLFGKWEGSNCAFGVDGCFGSENGLECIEITSLRALWARCFARGDRGSKIGMVGWMGGLDLIL